ncbi:unnamed protein product [Arctogadus glacialis]
MSICREASEKERAHVGPVSGLQVANTAGLFNRRIDFTVDSTGLWPTLQNIKGVHYRKSCASSGACLIASSGYQQFCTGKINSVCISCCNTALCNGPRPRKRTPPSAAAALDHSGPLVLSVLLLGQAALC